jgi:hypothetical protein
MVAISLGFVLLCVLLATWALCRSAAKADRQAERDHDEFLG